jgi:hypothetical protein
MRLSELIALLRVENQFERLRLDIGAQFGRESAPLYGASVLPERLVEANAFKESYVRYRQTLAMAGSSYSPAQLSTGGRVYGEIQVSLGNTNIKDQLIGPELDRLMRLVNLADSTNQRATIEAARQILNFVDVSIREPILKLNELYRWQAIIDGVVKRRGSNGYSEDVTYFSPAGHRVTIPGGTVAAPGGWYSKSATAYDPYLDFFAAQSFLRRKGYTISRIVSNYSAAFAFQSHPAVVNRLGGATFVDANGTPGRMMGSVNMDSVQAGLRANMLPQWDIYDTVYDNRNPATPAADEFMSGTRYLDRKYEPTTGVFVDAHPVVLLCQTGRDESVIDFGDRSSLPMGGITLQDTLGYYAVGTVTGEPGPGRKYSDRIETEHPGGYRAEMIQEGLPVITEPEAIYVMMVQAPAP